MDNSCEPSLKSRWIQFAQSFSSLRGDELNTVLENVWKEISTHYNESHRHYHNLAHIDACLNHLDLFLIHNSLNQNEQHALELAIWFHDIIYDSRKSDNEEKSANIATTLLSQFCKDDLLIKKVHTLILVTKHPSIAQNETEQLLLDIDLSILGSTPNLFKEYQQWIRLEYQHVPWPLFQLGRRKILKEFYKQTPIFKTSYFNEAFEINAKRNLKHALKTFI